SGFSHFCARPGTTVVLLNGTSGPSLTDRSASYAASMKEAFSRWSGLPVGSKLAGSVAMPAVYWPPVTGWPAFAVPPAGLDGLLLRDPQAVARATEPAPAAVSARTERRLSRRRHGVSLASICNLPGGCAWHNSRQANLPEPSSEKRAASIRLGP